jgi:hypothetical protein
MRLTRKRAVNGISGLSENADEGGLVGYLEKQAVSNPVAFMGLLGKVLPLQTTGEGGGPLEIRWLPPQEPPVE